MCNRVGRSQNYILEAGLFMSKNETGGACNMYGEEKRCIRACDGEIWGEDTRET